MGTERFAPIITFAAISLAVGCDRRDQTFQSPSPETLKQAREKTPLVLKPTDYRPSGEFSPSPFDAYRSIRYPSKVGPLAAYLTRDPADGKKHPLIVFAHGGCGGIEPYNIQIQGAVNDQSPELFRRAGFVVMYPSWRGENDNPGKLELDRGEVDDLLSATDFGRKLPYVDPDRVYLIGFDFGGTLALLAAELGAPVRLVISLGGSPNASAELDEVHNGLYKFRTPPFDWQDKEQLAVRSPLNFAADIHVPTWYIEGQLSTTNAQLAHEMEVQAKKYDAPFHTAFVQMSDHYTMQRPAKRLIAEKLLADTGKDLNFSLTHAESNDAYNKQRQAKPQIADKPFAVITPLGKAIIAEEFKAIARVEEQNHFSNTTHFIRVFLSPDNNPLADSDFVYDVDDVQCSADGIPVVIDRYSLDIVKQVRITLGPNDNQWLRVTRLLSTK